MPRAPAPLGTLDGFEVLHRLRAVDIAIPAILLTSCATPALMARAQAADMWRVLEKPVLDDELVLAVVALLPGPDMPLRENT